MAHLLSCIVSLILLASCCSDSEQRNLEPCKTQCDNNFTRNDDDQVNLVEVCRRGCDLFTMALISTPREIVIVGGTESIPREGLVGAKRATDFPSQHQPPPPKEYYTRADTRIPSTSSPSTSSFEGHRSDHGTPPATIQQNNSHGHNTTTLQPTSLPVQDKPITDHRQVTTDLPQKLVTKSSSKVLSFWAQMLRGSFLFGNKKLPSTVNKEETIKKVTNEERLEQAKHSCRHACASAYGGAANQEACLVGCHLQAMSVAIELSEKHRKASDSPLVLLKEVMFDVVTHFQKVANFVCSWVSPFRAHEAVNVGHQQLLPRREENVYGVDPEYFEETSRLARNRHSRVSSSNMGVDIYIESSAGRINHDNIPGADRFDSDVVLTISKENPFRNNIISIKSESERTNSFSSFSFQNDMDKPLSSAILSIKKQLNKAISPLSEPDNPGKPSENQNDIQRKRKPEEAYGGVHLSPKEPPLKHSDQQQQDIKKVQPQLDLLECISRKSGLPRWFIAVTVFASALIILWLCFSLTAPPEEVKVLKTKPPEYDCIYTDDEEEDTCGRLEKKLLPQYKDPLQLRLETV